MSAKRKGRAAVVAVLVIVVLALVCLVACDSTSGRSDTVSLVTYDRNDTFTLPIAVTKATTPPDSIRRFKSKLSLDEIYDSIAASSAFTVWRGESWLLVEDATDAGIGWCVIYAKDSGKFNYAACDMGCAVYTAENASLNQEVLLPLHLIPTAMAEEKMIEGAQYACTGTLDDIAAFYAAYDFEVTADGNTLTLRDTKGRIYGGESYYDNAAERHTLTLTDGMIVLDII